MIASRRTRELGFEDAEARLAEHLREDARVSPGRRAAVLLAAAVLFAVVFAARLAIDDPDALLANFYIVPIAILANRPQELQLMYLNPMTSVIIGLP